MTLLSFSEAMQALNEERARWPLLFEIIRAKAIADGQPTPPLSGNPIFDALETGLLETACLTSPPLTGDPLLDGAANPTPQWWGEWAKANESRRYPRPIVWDFWFQHELTIQAEQLRGLIAHARKAEAEQTQKKKEAIAAAERRKAEVRAMLSIEASARTRIDQNKGGRARIAGDDDLVARAIAGQVNGKTPEALLAVLVEEAWESAQRCGKLDSHRRRLRRKIKRAREAAA